MKGNSRKIGRGGLQGKNNKRRLLKEGEFLNRFTHLHILQIPEWLI